MFQWPGVGVGAFSIGTWITAGRSARQRLAQRRAELVGGLDHHAVRAARARHRRVVDAVRLAVALEHAAEGRAVVHLLEAGDRAERRVVHHQPDDVQVRFHRRRDHRRVGAEAAVADQRDGGAIRLRRP